MNIPNFKNDGYKYISSFTAPACDFEWQGHAIKLLRFFYYEDRSFNSDIQVFCDEQKVDVEEYLYGDGATDGESGIWTEHAYGIHDFSAYVQNFEEQPDEEFGEILERVVKWHLQRLSV